MGLDCIGWSAIEWGRLAKGVVRVCMPNKMKKKDDDPASKGAEEY